MTGGLRGEALWRGTAWLSFLIFLFGLPSAGAFEAISAGAGVDDEGTRIYRVEVQKGLGYRWLESESGYLLLSIDGSVDYWRNDEDSIVAGAVSPLLNYVFRTGGPILPFVEAGLGPAYISDTRLDEKDMGIHFQFQNIFGLGARLWKNHGIRLRALHYSNGGLDDANAGITFYTVSYHYRF